MIGLGSHRNRDGQVAAVVFDFFGTLTPARAPAEQLDARTDQAAALGVDPVAYDRVLTATYRERFRGRTGDVEGSLQWVADQLGSHPDPAAVARATQVRMATERRFADPRPDTVGVLRELQAAGLGIGVVSDCTAELPRCWDELPVAPFVDAAVFSCVTGRVKPEPENYLACCAELGVAAADCVYVGDGGSDELAGAARVGMYPVLLDVVAERGGVVYGRGGTWGGRTVGSLAEVAAVVAGLAGGG